MLLAGDVGGTKTDLAIFSRARGPHVPLLEANVRTADYPSLQALAKDFLNQNKVVVNFACFDVAGPVINGQAKVTNLPWQIDQVSLARDLNMKSVHLLNDLEAVARSVPILRPIDIATLNVGKPVPKGAIAVVAPGTGLGESYLTWNGSEYVSHSSEGGHSDFAPTDEREMGLLKYMLERHHHVGVERVCSGIGIPNIYDYLREVEQIRENSDIAESIASAVDRTPVITRAAFDKHNPSPLCGATIDTFVSILANEAANLALKVMATNGVYLAGGILLHLPRAYVAARFMESFRQKGRFSDLMARIPVHLILNRAALVGSAAYGLESFKEQS